MKHFIPIGFLILLLFTSCASLPKLSTFPSHEVMVAFGPEDIVIDSLSTKTNRLLISCSSRRKIDNKSRNGIYAMSFDNENIKELRRINEPENMEFHPHGFDIALIKGKPYLYVINHEDQIPKQSILVYEVYDDRLKYIKSINNDLIISPNDIFVNNDGSFYFSNDARKRGSKKEVILGQKKGSLIYFTPSLSPIIIDDHLAYPNGVYFSNGYLYVSTVGEKKLYRYLKDGEQFINKTCLTSVIKGGDNINPYKNGLLIPSHPSFIKFIKHKRKSKNPSPSLIYYYNFNSRITNIFFADDGTKISTASTALVYRNKLYISQVFDDFILIVDIE